jgi:arsenite-transporting ATPase
MPLALPIAVVERFISWVEAFDIPIGGIIVNCVIPKAGVNLEEASPYIVNKLREQDGYLKVIDEKFGEKVVAHLPLWRGR